MQQAICRNAMFQNTAGRKLRSSLAALLAIGALGALGTLSPGQTASAQTKVRVAYGTATSHPFHTYAVMFKEAAEKRSGGKLEVQLFPARQLCDDRQCLEGTVAGTIDASLVSTVLFPLVVKKPAFDALQLPLDRKSTRLNSSHT